MPTDAERIAKLEQEVKRLQIKLETLVNFLQFSHLGPPDGRAPLRREGKTSAGTGWPSRIALPHSRPHLLYRSAIVNEV